MVSYSFTGLLGTGQPTFSTNVYDLEVAWIGGLPRLFSASLPGEGAGYAEYDLSTPGAASLLAVRGYNTSVRPLSGIDFTIIPARSGSGGTLVAAGTKPWGWASHGLTGSAGFGDPLANALAFNPVAVTGALLGTANYVWFGLAGSSKILAATVSDTGVIKLTQALTAAPAGFSADGATIVPVAGWAGPWPIAMRWWDAAAARVANRFQLVDDRGTAWLLVLEDHFWWIEARYD